MHLNEVRSGMSGMSFYTSDEITLEKIIAVAESTRTDIYRVARIKTGDTVDVSPLLFTNMLNNRRFSRIFVNCGLLGTDIYAPYHGVWIHISLEEGCKEDKPERRLTKDEVKELERWLYQYSLVLEDDKGIYIDAASYVTLLPDDFKRLVVDLGPDVIIAELHSGEAAWFTFVANVCGIPTVFDTRIPLK